MKKLFIPLSFLAYISCNNVSSQSANDATVSSQKEEPAKSRQFKGAFSNGMKGDSLFFDLSADGKRIENFIFKGWWRCAGTLEILRAAGPDGYFDVVNGKVDDHISEPPDGGSTAWRFDLKATIDKNKATGSFRMNINNLGCDTYLLKFEAVAR